MPLHRLLLFLVAALPLWAQDYEIRLHRPVAVNQKQKISVSARDSNEILYLVDGWARHKEESSTTWILVGSLTVLEVGKNGAPHRASLEIGSLLKLEGGLRLELLAPGTVVIVSNAVTNIVCEVNGRAVNPGLALALRRVLFGFACPEDGDSDTMFGTPERKRVGDSWDANPAELAKIMNYFPELSWKEISGKTTLADVLTNGPTPRLLLHGDLSMKTHPMTMRGVRLEGSACVMKMTMEMPIDTNLPPTSEGCEMTWLFQGKGKPEPDGPEVEVRSKSKFSFQTR